MKIIKFIYMLYIYRIMAKTMMVSNEVYEDLKALKEKEDLSFSELFRELLKSAKRPKADVLTKFIGALKGDKEYEETLPKVKMEWKRWQKKYA